MMSKVIRITRHPADANRVEALRAAFGDDVIVFENDMQYGQDPVRSVAELIAQHGDVVAIEPIAPFAILSQLVDGRRKLGDVLILRAQFARGQDGRAIVVSKDASGRDVLAFGHYEVLERIEVKTRPLVRA